MIKIVHIITRMDKGGSAHKNTVSELRYLILWGIHFTGVVRKDPKLIVVPGLFLYMLLV